MTAALATELRKSQLDLEAVLTNHASAQTRFFVSSPKETHEAMLDAYFPTGLRPPSLENVEFDAVGCDVVFTDISVAVASIRASYLAPAIQFNQYVEWLAIDLERDEDKWTIDDEAPRPSNVLRRVSAEVYAHATLLSIKSGLDRLVRILSFYFAGVAGHTTWGRYSDNGKPSGFMAVVARGKENDPLLVEMDTAYQKWIRLAVAPRDALIHYEDSTSIWHFLSEEQAVLQTHLINDGKGNEYGFGIETLGEYVRGFYLLADRILLILATRLPRQLARHSK